MLTSLEVRFFFLARLNAHAGTAQQIIGLQLIRTPKPERCNQYYHPFVNHSSPLIIQYYEMIQDRLLPILLPFAAHKHTLIPLKGYSKLSSLTILKISFQQPYLYLIGMFCCNSIWVYQDRISLWWERRGCGFRWAGRYFRTKGKPLTSINFDTRNKSKREGKPTIIYMISDEAANSGSTLLDWTWDDHYVENLVVSPEFVINVLGR